MVTDTKFVFIFSIKRNISNSFELLQKHFVYLTIF